MARPKVHAIDIFFHPLDFFSRQQTTTITTFNGDTVAKGRVVLVVIVVHVVVNSKLLSLTLFFVTQKSRKSRKVPSARAALRKRSENFCDFRDFCVTKKLP